MKKHLKMLLIAIILVPCCALAFTACGKAGGLTRAQYATALRSVADVMGDLGAERTSASSVADGDPEPYELRSTGFVIVILDFFASVIEEKKVDPQKDVNLFTLKSGSVVEGEEMNANCFLILKYDEEEGRISGQWGVKHNNTSFNDDKYEMLTFTIDYDFYENELDGFYWDCYTVTKDDSICFESAEFDGVDLSDNGKEFTDKETAADDFKTWANGKIYENRADELAKINDYKFGGKKNLYAYLKASTNV